jgi:hypothetical protein
MPDRKVHVVLRKEDVYPERLADKIVMVIDAMVAASTDRASDAAAATLLIGPSAEACSGPFSARRRGSGLRAGARGLRDGCP